MTDIETNSNNEFMGDDLSKIRDSVPSRGIVGSLCLRVYFQFSKMFLQAQQEAIYLADIFQSACFNFLDVLHHLQNPQMQ